MTKVNPKSWLMKISDKMVEHLLNILLDCIVNKDEVMQIQLLNILKVIYFDTKDYHYEYIDSTKNIFGLQILNDCLNIGIQVSNVFVRNHYVDFIENCLLIYKSLLDEDANLRIANRLIINISDYLFRNAFQYKNKEENNNHFLLKLTSNDNKNNQITTTTETNKDNSSRYFIKNYDIENKIISKLL